MSLLDAAQFCYNLQKSSSTSLSTTELVLEHEPLTQLEGGKTKSQGECLATYRFAHDKQEHIEQARDSLVTR